jgi:threonylcarbamoyladenosine tRNA methylthiotransferase MtaB
MAGNTLQLIEDCEIIAAHIFPFSARHNTPAARMPQLAPELVKARAARLRSVAAEQRSRWLESQSGSVQAVLIEGDGIGHSDGFAPVALAGGVRGQTGLARVIGRNGDRLTAVWA